ncbi:hypothetical protein OYC64_008940 [Pagothenia borchgrevinki]|uniref:Uncharacterized protein n=1 Tax=Pagothenia borchgrevinki TaxID=8213 RepID=A0ABD2G7H8_PAGBO
MMIKEASLRGDPDLRGELAFLAKGCDFVLPSRFKKRLKSFQQQQVQAKPEKKPGTPPPAPALAPTTPTPPPRSPSPPPGSGDRHPPAAPCHQHSQVLLPPGAPCHGSGPRPRRRHRCHRGGLH